MLKWSAEIKSNQAASHENNSSKKMWNNVMYRPSVEPKKIFGHWILVLLFCHLHAQVNGICLSKIYFIIQVILILLKYGNKPGYMFSPNNLQQGDQASGISNYNGTFKTEKVTALHILFMHSKQEEFSGPAKPTHKKSLLSKKITKSTWFCSAAVGIHTPDSSSAKLKRTW